MVQAANNNTSYSWPNKYPHDSSCTSATSLTHSPSKWRRFFPSLQPPLSAGSPHPLRPGQLSVDFHWIQFLPRLTNSPQFRRLRVKCRYAEAGVRSDDLNSGAIDVVADVRPERVRLTSAYCTTTVWFLFLSVYVFVCVGCGVGRQWLCWLCYM